MFSLENLPPWDGIPENGRTVSPRASCAPEVFERFCAVLGLRGMR